MSTAKAKSWNEETHVNLSKQDRRLHRHASAKEHIFTW